MSDTPSWFDFKAHRERTAEIWQAISWREMASFIGPNSSRFEKVFHKLQPAFAERRGRAAIGWCWPAFFFGFAWLLYRKMYAAGLTLLLVPIVFTLLVGQSAGAAAGLHIAFSIFGKSFYLQHCASKLARMNNNRATPEEVARAGGVSIPAGIVGGAILLLAVASALLAA